MRAVIKHKYFATSYHQNTDKGLLPLKINEDDILSIIKNLNSNKLHGLDKLSIKTIKMCDKTSLSFKSHFQNIHSRRRFSGLLEKSQCCTYSQKGK